MMLAGYAMLRNSGDAPLTIVGAQSADFGDVSLHQSIEENGVEHMRPLGELSIAPGATVAFGPGGRHFMLMRPTHGLQIDDVVRIRIDTGSGAVATAEFVVREAAPAP